MGAVNLYSEKLSPYWWAKQEEGVSEYPGYRHNPRIIEYHATCFLKATTDETPWCSAFVNWCVKQARAQQAAAGVTQIPLETRNAMARSWLLWGVPVTDPREGDIVVFKRGNDGVSGHVGFFVKRDLLFVWVWGGNQDNCVELKKYLRKDVLGYRRAA